MTFLGRCDVYYEFGEFWGMFGQWKMRSVGTKKSSFEKQKGPNNHSIPACDCFNFRNTYPWHSRGSLTFFSANDRGVNTLHFFQLDAKCCVCANWAKGRKCCQILKVNLFKEKDAKRVFWTKYGWGWMLKCVESMTSRHTLKKQERISTNHDCVFVPHRTAWAASE